jgi:hypothetical protein
MRFSIPDICEQLRNKYGKTFQFVEGKFVEKIIHCMGNIYEISGDRYLLARTSLRKVSLINLQNGNCWHKDYEPKSIYNITEEELREICHDKLVYVDHISNFSIEHRG